LSTTYIKLDEVPDILQKKVAEALVWQSYTKLLSVSIYVSTPYKDKSITETRYTAYVQTGNYFKSFSFAICSNPEWTDREVRSNGMIAAEIIEFVKRCDWLQSGVKEALSREGS